MTDLFFYGSLRHLPLLEIVLGRAVGAGQLAAARLADHAVHVIAGDSWPTIQPAAGAAAPGLLLRGASAEDVARLDYYESGFGYALRPVAVATAEGGVVQARMWGPQAAAHEAGAPWQLADWAARWGAISCRAAVEAMAYYGRITPAELARRYGPMLLRAAARVAMQARPADPVHDLSRDVRLVDHRFAYVDFYGMEEARLQFRRHDGSMSPELERSALMTGAAAVVLPYDPVLDAVLLVEQFRAPLYLSGDPAPWLWEPVAGLIDPGETPDQAAHRETMEEAGLTLRRLEKVGEAYSSSGSSSEYVHLYVGLADLAGAEGIGGLASEGEDIRSQVLSFEALMDGVERHSYRDMPLLITALWLARHRDRLRG
ncbi:MAG: NUDIX domain-containing protein [Pseudodonghicola sp.]